MVQQQSCQFNLQYMSKSIKLNPLRVILLVAFIVAIATSIRKEKKVSPKTIVQANHFYSAENKLADYDITDITLGKPLVLLLKNGKSKYVTNFEITLTSGTQVTKCNFQKMTDLCIIPNTTSTLKMGIECKTLPCQVSWIIYQPEVKDPDSNQIALNLFTLRESNDHLIGQISCNDPKVTTLDQDVTIYSETPYRRIYKDNVLYVLFDNEKKGYVFIDIQQKSRACSKIEFSQAPQKLEVSDNSTTNFVVKESPVSYDLPSNLKGDFRFQCLTVRLDDLKQLKSSMIVTFFGTKDGENSEKKLVQHSLAVSIERRIPFVIAFKKIEGYSKLRIMFQVKTNQIMLFDTNLITGDVIPTALGKSIFFNLKQNQVLNFKAEGYEDAEDDQFSYFIPMRADELTLSKASCPMKGDCEFSVTAKKQTQNMIHISSRAINSTYVDANGHGLYEFQAIQFIPINTKAHKKIRTGDNYFFNKTLKMDQSIQVHVNSPNVIMYAASHKKCQVPDERCRERTGNYHHPFAYRAEQDCFLLINVEGLQNAQFQITIIEEQKFILLEDGAPFSYTMDSNEDRIDFKFKLEKQSDVSFNLVAPLNTLKLLVSNAKEELPDLQSAEQSTQGYIFIEKSEVKSLDFVISVVKIKQSGSFFTHFTIIVSSKYSKVRLDPAVTSYQTLSPSNYRDYVFEFDPSDNYILSFFIQNLQGQTIDIQVKVSDQQKKWDAVTPMTITKQSDFLDLNEVSMTLCEEEGELSCQIYLRITNKMQREIDVSVTLLMKNAVIELKDGIWQGFPQNLLTSTTNFYFYPRHEKQNIFVSYYSMIQQLRIAYRVWKYDANQINPAEWPFPKIIDTQQQLHANFKPNNYIMIDSQQMKRICWPSCLLLISFYIDYTQINKDSQLYLQTMNAPQYMNFKIMASNNHIQLPQKQRLSLTVAKNQQRYFLVDLRYMLEKQRITFFTTSAIGTCQMSANVYSEKNTECPTGNSGSDYNIAWGQYDIQMNDIKNKMKQKGMQDDNNKYLCLSIRSDASCKISIQYTGDSDGFKKISFDSTQEIVLGQNEVKYYQTDGTYQQYAKVTRLSGFPFVKIKKCSSQDKIHQCMEQFKKDEDKGKQIVVKTESFTEPECLFCQFLFKFSTVQPSKLNFHLQSKYSQLQLKQNVIFSDFLNENQETKYMIQADVKEDVIVNIHVQEGNIEAQITNLDKVNLNKKSDQKNKILHFVIKAHDSSQKVQSNGLLNPIALFNSIVVYHVTVKSTDSQKAATYTISYSSGKRQINLQDGLILDYILQPNKPTFFYYYNELASNHIYYTLSMDNAADLNQLKIKIYYLEDPNDQQSKKLVQVQKPTMNRKTPNPTILYSMPSQNYFMIQLTNPSSKEKRVSMGINHQQVILLPFEHEFPFQLHQKQQLNILVDVNIPGFLELTIRKCDRSQPNFAYSFDYDGFIKEEFMYNSKLTEQPFFRYTIKANRVGTLYVNFKADIDEGSIISMKVVHTEEKSKTEKMRAGKKGILSYELGHSSAKVTIPAVLCGDAACKGVKYYYISSPKEQEVFSQLFCSSSFFSTSGFSSSAPLALTKIDGKINNNTVIFDFPVKQSAYLGVKAVSESGEEVYYQPIEIASLWQKWNKVSIYQRILMIFLVTFCLCICLVFVRKASRKGYKPVDEIRE